MKLNAKHFIFTMTTFVAVVYIICAILILMAPVTSIKIANLLFHGLDLTKISRTIGFVAIQSFQISALKNSISGNVVESSSGSSGESYNDMMARMHPDQVTKSTSPSSQPTMVGGC